MQLRSYRQELHYHHEFRISRGGSETTETIILELLHDGLIGYGEAVPFEFLGWPAEQIEATLAAIAPRLATADPAHADSLSMDLLAEFGEVRPAVCAVSGALWDLHGQVLGQPVWRLLGLDPGRCGLTSFTLGIADRATLLAKADEAAQYPILKLKCGGPADLDNVRAIHEYTGKRLWVDANGGWNPDHAAELAGQLAELGVEVIEQPVPNGPGDVDGLAKVTAVSPIPVLADESCACLEDVVRLYGAVDGVNVKLDKVGGLSAALRTVHTARALGMKLMVGGFGSTSVSVTASAQLAPLIDYPDLDGALLTRDDPFLGMTAPNGVIALPDLPGLGLRRR